MTKTAKTKLHLSAHKGKYTAAGLCAVAVTLLQAFGALAPIICSMPWVTNKEACMAISQKAQAAGKELSNIQMEDGQPLPLELVKPAGDL